MLTSPFDGLKMLIVTTVLSLLYARVVKIDTL